MNERHLLSNLSYSDLKLGHSNGNKSLPKLITDKNSISDKKRRCKKTCRFFRRRWSFNLFSMRLRKKTSSYTPSCGSNSMPKYCENWSLWGRFLTPTLLHGPIWSWMSFSNFSSSTRWLFQIFFEKFQMCTSYFKAPLHYLKALKLVSETGLNRTSQRHY